MLKVDIIFWVWFSNYHIDMAHHPPNFRLLDLPEDIGRSIIEICAQDSQWMTICARVSRILKAWVEPILYRDLVLDTYHAMGLIHRTILDHPSKSPDFFARHVKSVLINCCPSWEQVMGVIEACSGVDTLRYHLWLQEGVRDDIRAHPAWKSLAPSYLVIPPNIFLPSSRTFDLKTNPIFSNVTRLDMYWDTKAKWSLDKLASLRNLEQFCITTSPSSSEENIEESERAIRAAIPFFPASLRVCILSIPWTQWHSDNARNIVTRNSRLDHRVIVAVDEYYWGLVFGTERWIEQAIWRHASGESARVDDTEEFWKRADAKVSGRSKIHC